MKQMKAFVKTQGDKQGEREKERQMHLLFEKAKDLLSVISNTAMTLEIREGTALSAWRYCATRFDDAPRDAFTSLFGDGLMRWIDERPASSGRIDSYLKGSH